MDSPWRVLLHKAGATFLNDEVLPRHFGDAIGEYTSLTADAGVVDLSDRTQIELTGADRQAFLHNLCTNEIKRLAPGSGCEAFLCNAQGHVLGLVYVFCGAESLTIETVAGQAEKLAGHLDRYLIREKVEILPRSEDWAELLIAGPRADAVLRTFSVPLPEKLYDHRVIPLGDVPAAVRSVDWTGPSAYLLSVPRELLAAAWEALRTAGAAPCGLDAFEMARVEAGTPLFGRDVSDDNLPQEIARDARAISFVKGCYIGQETVARLDARGHVNRLLVGLRFDQPEIPAIGTELTGEGSKVVGRVTSAAFSPRLDTPLALGFVRRELATPGTHLTVAGGTAEVVALPAGA